MTTGLTYQQLKESRDKEKRLRDKAREAGNIVVERVAEYKYREACKAIKKRFRCES